MRLITGIQECEGELTQKGEMVSRLQVKATHIGRILSNLERSYDCTPMSSPSTQQPPPMKKPHLRIDPIPPFNANRIRKSPSGLAATTTINAQSVSQQLDLPPELGKNEAGEAD